MNFGIHRRPTCVQHYFNVVFIRNLAVRVATQVCDNSVQCHYGFIRIQLWKNFVGPFTCRQLHLEQNAMKAVNSFFLQIVDECSKHSGSSPENYGCSAHPGIQLQDQTERMRFLAQSHCHVELEDPN